MRKNNFVVFIALLLVMIIPVMAFASPANDYREEGLKAAKEQVVKYELGIMPGMFANEKGEDGVADLLKAIAIETHSLGDKQFALNLLLNAVPELTLLVNTDENGTIFAEIPQFQAPVFEITLEDIFAAMEANGQKIDDRQKLEIAKLLKGDEDDLEEIFGEFDNEGVKLDLEELKNPEKTGDEVLDAWFAEKAKTMEFVENPEENPKHDKAVYKVSMKLNNEDILTIMSSKTAQEAIMAQAAAMQQSTQATGTTETPDFATVFQQGLEAYKTGAVVLDATVSYYIDAESYLVAMEIPMTMDVDAEKMAELNKKLAAEQQPQESDMEQPPVQQSVGKMDMNFNYYRLTENNFYNHKVEFPVNIDGKTIMNTTFAVNVPTDDDIQQYNLKANVELNDETNGKMELGVNSDLIWNGNKAHGVTALKLQQAENVTGATIDVNSEVSDAEGIVTKFDVYVKMGPAEAYTPEVTENDMKFATITVTEQFVEPTEVFEAQPAKAENKVRILTLGSEEMEALTTQLEPALQQWLGGLMQKLPATFLNMIMPQQETAQP